MKLYSWNVRGLNDPYKHGEVGKLFWGERVDVLGVLETRVKYHKAERIRMKVFKNLRLAY